MYFSRSIDPHAQPSEKSEEKSPLALSVPEVTPTRSATRARDSARRGGSCASSVYAARSEGSITLDAWQHVAVTAASAADGTTRVKIYVDGVETADASVPPDAPAARRLGRFSSDGSLGEEEEGASSGEMARAGTPLSRLTIGASGSPSCAANGAAGDPDASCSACGCFAGGASSRARERARPRLCRRLVGCSR